MSKLVLAVLASSAFVLAGCSHNAPATSPTSLEGLVEEAPAAEAPASEGMQVMYENGAFSPAEITLKVGEKVMFKNGHTAAVRVSSNPHPSHTSYPTFDSDVMAPGDTWEFTAEKAGTIEYHNHFNPAVMGKVVVE